MSITERIAALRAAEQAATPGPWTSACDKRLSPSDDYPGMSSRVLVDRPNYDDSFVIRGGNPLGISCGNVVCSADSYSGESGSPDDINNAAFIALTRNELPGFIAAFEALRTELIEATYRLSAYEASESCEPVNGCTEEEATAEVDALIASKWGER